ncbi:MAG: hypothetical protein ABJG88_02505 [Litorimonas sp.]
MANHINKTHVKKTNAGKRLCGTVLCSAKDVSDMRHCHYHLSQKLMRLPIFGGNQSRHYISASIA